MLFQGKENWRVRKRPQVYWHSRILDRELPLHLCGCPKERTERRLPSQHQNLPEFLAAGLIRNSMHTPYQTACSLDPTVRRRRQVQLAFLHYNLLLAVFFWLGNIEGCIWRNVLRCAIYVYIQWLWIDIIFTSFVYSCINQQIVHTFHCVVVVIDTVHTYSFTSCYYIRMLFSSQASSIQLIRNQTLNEGKHLFGCEIGMYNRL